MSEANTYEKGDIILRASKDLNFFASLLIPEVMSTKYPDYYQFLWSHFMSELARMDEGIERDQATASCLRFALGLPRNHAKTMFIKLFACYCVLYDLADFILLVCASEKLAQNALEDIDMMLDCDVVQQVWGNWRAALSKDTQALKRARYNGKTKILAALGAGSSLRGLNVGNLRPDFIIMDDIQTREGALSKVENEALLSWLFATLIKARNMKRAFLIYIGNMYNDTCILKQLKDHPQWETFITGAILPDWTPLWKELFTLDDLINEYKHDEHVGLGEIWFAEVMNVPSGGEAALLGRGKFPMSTLTEFDEHIAAFITVDLAGYRKHSDDNVIALHKVYSADKYVVDDLLAGNFNPEEVVQKAILLAIEHNVTIIGVEMVGYQQSARWYFEKALAELGMQNTITLVELKPKQRQKTARIKSFVDDVYAGVYELGDKVMPKFLFQARGFRMDRKDNKDDILDAIAYGKDIRAEYGNQLLLASVHTKRKIESVGVVANNSFLD